ncbi:hypothetical protein HMI54_006299 [Coelomomyces lativittatus]|nr:hypothetical protein HMI54_006299 [Coelomomyces lativittatus]
MEYLSEHQMYVSSSWKCMIEKFQRMYSNLQKNHAFEIEEAIQRENLLNKQIYHHELDLKNQELHQKAQEMEQAEIQWNQKLHHYENEKVHFLEEIKNKNREFDALQTEIATTKETQHSFHKSLEQQLIDKVAELNNEKEKSKQYHDQIEQLQQKIMELESSLRIETEKVLQVQNEVPSLAISLRLRQLETQLQAELQEKELLTQSHQHQIHDLQSTFQERYHQLRLEARETIEIHLRKEWEERWAQQQSQWDKFQVQSDQEKNEWVQRHEVKEKELLRCQEELKNQKIQCQCTVDTWKQKYDQLSAELKLTEKRWEEERRTWLHDRSTLESTLQSMKIESQSSASPPFPMTQEVSKDELDQLHLQYQKEMDVLKETIRQECEERLKLLDSLSLQKASMNNLTSMPNLNNLSLSQDTIHLREEEVLVEKKELEKGEAGFEAKLMAATRKKKKQIKSRTLHSGYQGEWQRL